jgi:hypothetical protein
MWNSARTDIWRRVVRATVADVVELAIVSNGAMLGIAAT